MHIVGNFSARICVFLAPPARPIPGLQLTTSSAAGTVDHLSTAVAGMSSASVDGLSSVASKSVPATPVSTPMVEQQPSGVMSRILGAAAKSPQPAAEQPTSTRSRLFSYYRWLRQI